MASAPICNDDHEIATLSLDGRRFGIACATDEAGLRDIVSARYRSGDFSPVQLLVAVARAVVEPGSRVLDLGAHVGGFAVTAAALGCKVLAIEASPRNVFLLEASRRHNEFGDLHVEHTAVGDVEGEIRFQANGAWGQVASAADIGSVRVPVSTIDSILDRHGWSGVDFVKLDVEGYEPRVLLGGSRLFGAVDAPPVFFESNRSTLAAFGESPESLKAEFLRLGYTVYHVRSGVLVPVRSGERQRKECVDYLACKQVPVGLRDWLQPSIRSLAWRTKHALEFLRR